MLIASINFKKGANVNQLRQHLLNMFLEKFDLKSVYFKTKLTCVADECFLLEKIENFVLLMSAMKHSNHTNS